MATIEISDEDLKFLQDLAHEMNTQDRRATADPYYFTVRTYEEQFVTPGEGSRDIFWDGADQRSYSSEKEAFLSFLDQGYTGKSADIKKDGLVEYGVKDVPRYSNFFLTEKACDRFIELNKHNYPSSGEHKTESYVEHAYRNPELTALVEIIKRIGYEIRTTADT